MKRQGFAFIVLTMLIFTLLASTTVNVADASGECTIMTPDHEAFEEWLETYNSQPVAYIDPGLVLPESSFSLLSHINYIPVERDQGLCGNCWVWAGTGVLEIALDVQCGNKDRLSIQYLTSCFNGGTGPNWACCGGFLNWLAGFYSGAGFAIPWSNTNAHWQDGGRRCSDGGTTVPCGTISPSPNYPITSITAQTIPTHGVGQAAAISNIKNILHQNRGVYFAFYMCADDWNVFRTFWWTQPETVTWDPDTTCGHVCTPPDCYGGHGVLCVGYNDDDPNNKYWIMLNSWGTAGGGRPNGLFRVKMDINYDCTFIDDCQDPPVEFYSLYWETLDVDFECPTPPVGGLWVPVNRIELLAPWIGVCSIVASVAVVVVAVKKRKP